MTLHEYIQWAYFLLALLLFLGLGVMTALLPIAAERDRRRREAVDRDIDARRAQFPVGELNAAVESALTGGRITPKEAQRFIDRGWLDPR